MADLDRALPCFDIQADDAHEFVDVSCDENRVVCQGGGGDQHVVVADWRTRTLQVRAYSTVVFRYSGVYIEHAKWRDEAANCS